MYDRIDGVLDNNFNDSGEAKSRILRSGLVYQIQNVTQLPFGWFSCPVNDKSVMLGQSYRLYPNCDL